MSDTLPKESKIQTNELQSIQQNSVSKASSIAQSKSNSETAQFNIKNKHPVKPIIYTLFHVLNFVCNFNYSVENAIITMMMITFLTPNIIDSLIWIIPNIVSILVRPYLIRYVHKTHKAHKIRSEAFLVYTFLFLTAVGSFLIGQSGLMNESKKGFHGLRILVCSIGWTLTGMSLELIEYFAQKLKESFENQCYILNSQTIKQTNIEKSQVPQFMNINFEEEETKSTLMTNFKFLGSIAGYLVVWALFKFHFKNIKKMSSFFEQSSLVYNINGFLTLFGAIAFYAMIAYSGIPKQDPELKPKPVSFKLSYSLNYYLPGFSQLKSMSLRGLVFLAIHFMVTFVMDVMFIYTTMWTAGSVEASDMKVSQANFYGINKGVISLIVFTFVYYGQFFNHVKNKGMSGWKVLIFLTSILFVTCFWFMKSLLFYPLIILLAIFYKTYEKKIEPTLEEIEPEIKVCKEVIMRIQKVAVLNILPFISMILLGRDDIQDCLIWCSILLISIAILLTFFPKGNPEGENTHVVVNKVDKEKRE